MITTTRQNYIDAAKGIGIVLVVYGHVQRGLMGADIISASALWQWVDYTIYLFHMPLFFFLAGLVVEKSLAKGTRRFLVGKLQTIIYPYFLWSVLQGVMQYLANGNAADLPTPDRLLGITGLPIGQFWFLYALMMCHAAYAVCRRPVAGSRKPEIVLMLVALVMLALVPYAPERLATLLRHFVFYAGGIALARGWETGNGKRETEVSCRFPVTVFLFVILAALNGLYNDMAINGFLPLPASVLGIAIVICVAKALRGRAEAVCVYLGRMSMSIFVMHVIALAGMRAVLLKLGVDNVVVHLAAGVGAGLVLPVAAHLILQRMKLLPFAGLAPFTSKSTY